LNKTFILLAFLVAPLLMLACNPMMITPKLPLATPTITPTPTYTPTPLPTNTPCPGTGVIGSQILASYSGVAAVGYFGRYQASANVTILSLSIADQSIGTNFELGVYADNGSGTDPTTLLGETGVQTVYASGINVAPIAPPATLTSGNYYWLGMVCNGMIGITNGSNVDVTSNISSLPVSVIPYYFNPSGGQFTFFGNSCY
jgi:hypothetical protein